MNSSQHCECGESRSKTATDLFENVSRLDNRTY